MLRIKRTAVNSNVASDLKCCFDCECSFLWLLTVRQMASNVISLKWTRPESTEYPKVWHRFMARDLNSDNLVEYRIEDLCIENANAAYEHMRQNYLKDEPICETMRKFIV